LIYVHIGTEPDLILFCVDAYIVGHKKVTVSVMHLAEFGLVKPCWKAWSTRGLRNGPCVEIAKNGHFFVKQVLMVHAQGPRRRPRVDIAKVHAQTTHKVGTWSARGPHVKTLKFQQQQKKLGTFP
jgi:hypothetical protein